MKTAAIYCRVSTKRQKEDGSSLQTQSEACLDLAKKNDYEVPEGLVFEEDWPGSTIDRPVLDTARDLVREREIDALIVYSTDRLSRNPIHTAILAEECEKHRVSLHFVTEPLDTSPEGMLILYVKGYAAQIERVKIADRSVRGKRVRAKQGKIPGGCGIGLYGYEYIPGNEDGQGIRKIKEDQAEIVRMMFRLLVEDRMTLYGICVKLTELEIPSPKGTRRWGLSTVARILRNPAYMGKTYAFTHLSVEPKNPKNLNKRYANVSRQLRPREEWIEIPGATPAIISEETFQLAHEQLWKNRDRACRNQKYRYLLSGHIRCGICGKRLNGYRSANGHSSPNSVLRYRCAGRYKTESIIPCPSRSIRADEIEPLVWEEIKNVLTHPEFVLTELKRRQEEASDREKVEEQAKLLDTRIGRIDRSMQRLVKLYQLGEIDDEYIINDNKKLKEEKQRLIQEKEALKDKHEVHTVTDFQIEAVKEYCERATQNIEHFAFEEKRLALKALDMKAIVKPEGIAIQGTIPSIASTSSRSWAMA